MPIITISRGSYSKGKEVAEKVSQKLGYECISRDVLLEASEEFNVPEIKLIRAIHNSPSILNSFTHGREKYIVYIQAALLRHLSKDNIVYHGLAGHFLGYNTVWMWSWKYRDDSLWGVLHPAEEPGRRIDVKEASFLEIRAAFAGLRSTAFKAHEQYEASLTKHAAAPPAPLDLGKIEEQP